MISTKTVIARRLNFSDSVLKSKKCDKYSNKTILCWRTIVQFARDIIHAFYLYTSFAQRWLWSHFSMASRWFWTLPNHLFRYWSENCADAKFIRTLDEWRGDFTIGHSGDIFDCFTCGWEDALTLAKWNNVGRALFWTSIPVWRQNEHHKKFSTFGLQR